MPHTPANKRKYYIGDQVYWVTGERYATVIDVKPYGDIVIKPNGSSVPITTRAVFLRPKK